jgi:flagellar biosynthesis/type III secretory pathway protein FliH
MTSSPEFVPESVLLWIPPLLEPWEGERRSTATPPAVETAWKPAELDPRPAAPPPPKNDVDEAFQRGFADGVRDGASRAESRIAPALATLQAVAERVESDRERHARDRARDVQALALAVARKLTMRAAADDPGVVTELVQRALELMPADQPIEVRLSLADLEAMSGSIERLSANGGPGLLRWIADPELGRGSFVLECPTRLVDGRLDVALRGLFEALDR